MKYSYFCTFDWLFAVGYIPLPLFFFLLAWLLNLRCHTASA